MSFIHPIPCDNGGETANCCPTIVTGYCLSNGTPIAITIVNGVQTTWTNLLTGVVTPGPPPFGAGICPIGDIEVVIRPLECAIDAVTICPGTDPIAVIGTIELGAASLAALETITVLQGTSPWVIGDGGGSITVDGAIVADTNFDYPEDSAHASGNVGAYVLAARSDVANSNTTTDGDYSSFQTDQYGGLWISPTARIATTLSSVAPLGISASFTSPWIPVSGISSIRVGILTDQAGILFTQHSDDNGVTILRSSPQPVEANKGEFLSFHPRSSYFRVVYTNGTTAQTSLHLETIIHTAAIAPTESLVSAKLSRNSLALQTRDIIYDYEFDESVGVAPQIRDMFVVQRVSLLADNFRQSTGLDGQSWTQTSSGSGSSNVNNGRLEMATGATANSTTRVESVVKGRFISGSHQIFRAGIKLADAGLLNNTMRWGVYDDISGYFYELDGAILYAVSRRASVDTRVAAANWNTISTFVLPVAGSSNRFEISYFGNTAYFTVNGETHHVMSGEVGGVPRTNGTNFPNRFENINSAGNTAARMLVITGTSQQRYGPDQVSPRMYFISGPGTFTLKGDAGNLHRISVLDGSGANTAAIYDSIIGSGVIIAEMNVDKLQGSVEFGGCFNNGLTVVTTGADTKLSVVFD